MNTPKFRRRDGRSLRRARFPSISYTPGQVTRIYGFPAQLTGQGYKAGIISLDGVCSQSDFNAARQAWGLPSKSVFVYPVNGNIGQPDPGGADVENDMDCQIVTGIAPGADINLYSAANTDREFIAAVTKALNDGCDAITISWGSDEKNWSDSARAAFDQVFLACTAANVNVSVAAGDNGSSDGDPGNNADYPASSRYVVACGGTSLYAPSGVLQSEHVWNNGAQGGATGGGYSIYEPIPTYQHGIVTGANRGEPDLAGPADPETGWQIHTGGAWTVLGGTSAVAPLVAGLYLLLCEQNGGRPGFLNPLLYPHPEAFHDIITGSNGAYKARAGWDECTGNGSPKGSVLFSLPPFSGGKLPPSPPPSPPPPPVKRPPFPCLRGLGAEIKPLLPTLRNLLEQLEKVE